MIDSRLDQGAAGRAAYSPRRQLIKAKSRPDRGGLREHIKLKHPILSSFWKYQCLVLFFFLILTWGYHAHWFQSDGKGGGEKHRCEKETLFASRTHLRGGPHWQPSQRCPDWDLLVPRATPARAGVWFLIHCVCMGSSGLGRPQRLC